MDELPLPAYHLVQDVAHRYHFRMMAGRGAGYALIEGSRGCPHRCTFCSQWKHWAGAYRTKSPECIADEMEYCLDDLGARLVWLVDDNFGLGANEGAIQRNTTARTVRRDHVIHAGAIR